jgi:hypothetical protein
MIARKCPQICRQLLINDKRNLNTKTASKTELKTIAKRLRKTPQKTLRKTHQNECKKKRPIPLQNDTIRSRNVTENRKGKKDNPKRIDQNRTEDIFRAVGEDFWRESDQQSESEPKPTKDR